MSYSSERILVSSQREGQVSRFRAWVMLRCRWPRSCFRFTFRSFSSFWLSGIAAAGGGVLRPDAANPISGLLMGAVVGLAQDSLSKNPLGMFGIVNTLVGYFAASVGLRLDVDHGFIRLLLSFFFYVFHQVLYWVMARALLGQQFRKCPAHSLAGAAECGGRHCAYSLPGSAAGNCVTLVFLAVLQFAAYRRGSRVRRQRPAGTRRLGRIGGWRS